MVKEVSKNEFIELIKNVVLVDFFAHWCGPCKMFSPIFEIISNKTTIPCVKIDIDKEDELTSIYNIQYVPSLVLFKNGILKAFYTGIKSEKEILKWLNLEK